MPWILGSLHVSMTAILQLGGTWSIALIYFVTALRVGVRVRGVIPLERMSNCFGFVVQSHMKPHEKAEFLCEQ